MAERWGFSLGEDSEEDGDANECDDERRSQSGSDSDSDSDSDQEMDKIDARQPLFKSLHPPFIHLPHLVSPSHSFPSFRNNHTHVGIPAEIEEEDLMPDTTDTEALDAELEEEEALDRLDEEMGMCGLRADRSVWEEWGLEGEIPAELLSAMEDVEPENVNDKGQGVGGANRKRGAGRQGDKDDATREAEETALAREVAAIQAEVDEAEKQKKKNKRDRMDEGEWGGGNGVGSGDDTGPEPPKKRMRRRWGGAVEAGTVAANDFGGGDGHLQVEPGAGNAPPPDPEVGPSATEADPTPPPTLPAKKRGRPKGSKNKTPTALARVAAKFKRSKTKRQRQQNSEEDESDGEMRERDAAMGRLTYAEPDGVKVKSVAFIEDSDEYDE